MRVLGVSTCLHCNVKVDYNINELSYQHKLRVSVLISEPAARPRSAPGPADVLTPVPRGGRPYEISSPQWVILPNLVSSVWVQISDMRSSGQTSGHPEGIYMYTLTGTPVMLLLVNTHYQVVPFQATFWAPLYPTAWRTDQNVVDMSSPTTCVVSDNSRIWLDSSSSVQELIN